MVFQKYNFFMVFPMYIFAVSTFAKVRICSNTFYCHNSRVSFLNYETKKNCHIFFYVPPSLQIVVSQMSNCYTAYRTERLFSLVYRGTIQILRKHVFRDFLTHPPTLCVNQKWPISEPIHPVFTYVIFEWSLKHRMTMKNLVIMADLLFLSELQDPNGTCASCVYCVVPQ